MSRQLATRGQGTDVHGHLSTSTSATMTGLLIVSTVPAHSCGVRGPPEATAFRIEHTCNGQACSARHSQHVCSQWGGGGLPCTTPVTGRENFPCMGTFSHTILVTLAFPCLLRDLGLTTIDCSHRCPLPPKTPSPQKQWQPPKDSVPCRAGPWQRG